MTKTAEEWLALGDELPLELAKALVNKAKHKWLEPAVYYGPTASLGYVVKCQKCGHVDTVAEESDGCPVPDPITIDWNTAKYWQGKCDEKSFYAALWWVHNEECEHMPNEHEGHWVSHVFERWVVYIVDARRWLIAAAMAAERKEE